MKKAFTAVTTALLAPAIWAFVFATLALLTGCGEYPPRSYPRSIDTTFCDTAAIASTRAAIVHGEVSSDDRSTVEVFADRGYCSGTMIGDGIVLTAAHCGEATTVRAGSSRVSVVHTELHPDYDPESLHADLALVFLAYELNNVPNAPIGIPEAGKALIQGYGADEHGEAGTLREATVTVDGFSGGKAWTTSTGAPSGDSCFGDSGGPMYQRGKLVGITSHGTAGANADCGYGGAYTTPASYLDWITEQTAISGESC